MFFVFAKSTLKNLFACRQKYPEIKDRAIATSRGFTIPRAIAEKVCARAIHFNLYGGIDRVVCGGEISPIDLSDIERPADHQMRLGLGVM